MYGVDIVTQRRYPFPFHQDDAGLVLRDLLAGLRVVFSTADGRDVEHLSLSDFSAIHASPPCRAYSVTRHSHSKKHPELIAPTRDALLRTGLPYVIENVEGARNELRDPMLLCGTMFGLRATDLDGQPLALRRHRLFESNLFLMSAGGCSHDGTQVAGVYGGGPMQRNKSDRRGGYTPKRSVRAELMGIDWATQHGLSQAIPPAYTEFIGAQLLKALEVAA
ncbi:hypothetical protein [Humibacter sp.]|uniref:hypothetical protein n=1 Tax=Humibacter sp. TaxID=1940291 RepID=UPI003F7D2757